MVILPLAAARMVGGRTPHVSHSVEATTSAWAMRAVKCIVMGSLLDANGTQTIARSIPIAPNTAPRVQSIPMVILPLAAPLVVGGETRRAEPHACGSELQTCRRSGKPHVA